MIRHLVFFKFHEDKRHLLSQAVEKILSMKGGIPGVLDIKAGVDLVKSPRSWDLGLSVDLEDLEALKTYQDHPVHKPVKEFLAGLYKDAASIDFSY